MHPVIFGEFERICAEHDVRGSVLEIGAIPSRRSLLCLRSLERATERVGINLDGPHEFDGFTIQKGNANEMRCFEDGRFDAVLCNAVLEHDKFFWKTLAEIRRVTRPGGLVVIGVPGYEYFALERGKRLLRMVPGVRGLSTNRYLNMFFTSTITYQIHNEPGDYYRFSPQTFRDVFFDGMKDVSVRSVMLPPRIIGAGRTPS